MCAWKIAAGLVALALWGGAPVGAASRSAVRAEAARPSSGPAIVEPSSYGAAVDPVVRAVMAFAFLRLGAGYSMINRFGPRSYDCSSFVYLAYLFAGVRVGETTQAWLEEDSPLRRFEVLGRPARPGDVIVVPREVLNKHFAERGGGVTGFNHALIAARTDPLTGRITWVVDASGSRGVTFRRAPAYVGYPGVRVFRPR